MGVVDNIFSLFSSKKVAEEKPILESETSTSGAGKKHRVRADFGNIQNSFAISFNGEKSFGEIGPIIKYDLDYDGLRHRSWKSYLDSELAQAVLKKWAIWNVGTGLKLQLEPSKHIFEKYNVTLDIEKYNTDVETQFQFFAKSKRSDYAGMESLHRKAYSTLLNAIIGGDALIVQRYEDGQHTVQLIDGGNVATPYTVMSNPDPNVTIKNGIEMDKKGKHVAFWVRDKNNNFERIAAYNSIGMQQAFLVYGFKYRLDNNRGIPLISAVMETIAKLERYKEATVGSAEERQKIAFAVEHNQFSTGENPLDSLKHLAPGMQNNDDGKLGVDEQGEIIANKVAVTTRKSAFNLPIGSKLVSLESKNELYFEPFYTVNIVLICACIGIPHDVAMSKYDSNFSASRAALKDWEHTLNVGNSNFSEDFYKPIFDFWYQIQVFEGNIDAPGYTTAVINKNFVLQDNYKNARFVGPKVPHIDPVKEVNAERLKLGDAGKNMPLTTLEAATEALNSGDALANIQQFGREYKATKDSNIMEMPVQAPTPPTNP